MIVDYAGLDAIIGREPGKRRPERIPVSEAKPDEHQADSAWMPPDLVSVPEEEWQAAVERFEILKPLITTDRAKRTLTDIKRAARVLGRHPVTVYRWIENYKRCERLSVFLRKRRSDRGTGRLSSNVETIIDTAIKSVYLTAEKPTMMAVTEEVYLQCFKNKIKKKPAPNTIRARILALSDHLRVEKREGKKRAAEKYEPIKGHFPGADRPLAVAQIDHTPMDVIVVDEEHRQPIQRPLLTVVIDVYGSPAASERKFTVAYCTQC
jgi:putative transposase